MKLINKKEIGSHQITSIVTDTLWAQNCYLITDNKCGEQVLIDPGNNPELIIQTIIENGNGTINYVLLTHAHFDHVGAVAPVCKKFNVTTYIHKADARLLRHAPMYSLRFAQKPIPQPEPFTTFEEQPEISICEKLINVLHVPGHSFGSVCYCFEGFVFTGDTLMKNYVGRVDLPGSNLSLLKKSIPYLFENLSEETVIFAGHGKPWSISEATSWWEKSKTSIPHHDSFIK
jgi:hydroxyacylglutathione hydrolase